MYLVKLFVFLLFISSGITKVYSQGLVNADPGFQKYARKTYTVKDGLPSKNTTAAIKDKRGFLWIGTENGLCKFDGYSFKTFVSISGDSTSITNNYINAIIEDKNGRLWVATMDGLNLFNPVTEKSKRFFHRDDVPGTLSNNKVWSLLCDKKGGIWVGTDYGFNEFVEKTNSFRTYLPNPKISGSIKGKSVNAIIEDQDNNLWLGNWSSGLNKFEKSTKRFTNYTQATVPNQKNPNDVWTLSLTADGSIWVGTYWKGLFKFDPKAGKFTAYPNVDKQNISVFRILQTQKDILLVAGNAGFYWLNTINNRWTKIDQLSGFANCGLYNDLNGIIWICSRDGLTKLDYKQYKFSFLPLSLGEKDMKTLLAQDSTLWLGTNNGLFKYNLIRGTKTDFIHTRDPNGITNSDISKLYVDRKGKLWVLTENGFDEYLADKKKFIHHYHHSDLGSLFNEDVFRDILEIGPGEYWLATDAGLKIYNSGTNSFKHYYADEKNPFSLNNNHLYSLIKDAKNNVWIATYGGGLNRFDPASGRFQAYVFNGKKGSISNNIIEKLFLDSRKNLWICTTDGLNKFIPETNSFKVYSKRDGFAGNVFYDLVEDEDANLWIITDKGMSKFNPETEEIKNFDEADGLYSNNTISRTKSGKIYLAGNKGIVYFNPRTVKYNKDVVPVYFTDFQIFNKTVLPGKNSALRQPLGIAREVVLKYDQNVFSFEFVALNYTHSEKNRYAYKLEGFDKDWNYVVKQRIASYTNLNPGTYTLKVIASNNDGLWNRRGQSIRIIILPPWYLTWWAYVLYAAVFAGILYVYVVYRDKQADLKYEVKIAHIESEKEMELNEKKLEFFTNVSHELRTPLTLIINPLRELISAKNKTEDVATLNIIYRNARRLLSLVDQLLLFRKAESDTDQLKISKIDIAAVCHDVFLCFLHQSRFKNLDYQFIQSDTVIEIYADREKIEIALFNLISNALKFTPDKGSIIVSVLESADHVEIQVKDTGCGIPEQIGEMLYNRFYQSPNSNSSLKSGFGIGLYLVKNFIERHGGSIAYSKNEVSGTVFCIKLLKGKSHLHSEFIDETPSRESEFLQELLEDGVTAAQQSKAPEQAVTLNCLGAEAKSLLIIDDNFDIREYIKQLFASEYLLYEAGSAEQGYQMIREVMPDLIISDVMMPGMSGLELCKLIKVDDALSHIPIILLTANSSSEVMLKGLEEGADDYISKPFDKEVLKLKVENILTSKNNLQRYFYDQITLKSSNLKISVEYKDFLDKCIEVVEAHLTDPDFNIQVLAAEIGMSRSNLFKKIKSISGQSSNSFIRSIRLRKAAEIFINTNNTIMETSYLIGINDSKYFRAQFNKLFKMNPSEYIKKYRKPFSNTLNVNLHSTRSEIKL